MRTNFSRLLGLTVVIGVCTPAYAQPGSDTRASGLEEIIVTAQRREQSLQEVAISVTAFDSEAISALGFTTPEDIAWQTPGLYARATRGGNSNPVFALRGIGVNDQNSNNSPSISLYVDEVNQPFSPMLTFQLMDLERIEVLKGPQGTLYGKNTTGGALNFITRKPEWEPSGYVQANYDARYRATRVEGAFGGPLTDQLAGRISVMGLNQDRGWQTNKLLGNNVGEAEEWAVRGQLLWDSGGVFSALASANIGESKKDGYYNETISTLDRSAFSEPIVVGEFLGQGPFCPSVLMGFRDEDRCVNQMGYSDPHPNPRDVDGPFDLVNKTETFGLSLNLSWNFDLVTITSISSYSRIQQDLMDGYGTALIILESAFEDEIDVYSTELRANSNSDGPWTWVIGGFLAREELDHRFIQSLDDWFFPFDAVGAEFDQRGDTAAIFAHIEYDLTRSLSIGGGLRYTYEDKKQRNFRNYIFTNPPGERFPASPYVPVFSGGLANWPGAALAVDVDNQVTMKEWSGELSLNYAITDDAGTYIKVSRGVKSGGFMGAISFSEPQASSFNEESVTAIEIGVKSEILDRTLRLNVAAYYYDWEDLQARTLVNVNGLGLVILTNAGDAEIVGVEAEALWQPSRLPGLTVSAGLNYMDAEITSGEFDGDRLSSAPKWMFNGVGRYEISVEGANWRPYVQASTSYQHTNYLTLPNFHLHRNDAFWLTNARLGVIAMDDRLDVALWVTNLTDELYLSNTADTGLSSFPSVNQYAAPRRFGLDMRYRF